MPPATPPNSTFKTSRDSLSSPSADLPSSQSTVHQSAESPYQDDFDALIQTINEETLFLNGVDGPAFLWSRFITDSSNERGPELLDSPVAPVNQARSMMIIPMKWYFSTMASTAPTKVSNDQGYEIPSMDMRSFKLESKALSGVEAVVANALSSNHWQDAAVNLALAIDVTSDFLGKIADRDDQGLGFLKNLIEQVRIYFNTLASQADPSSRAQALQCIVSVACKETFLLNPMQMIELLSCCLSFAQWDDSRVLAYDAISQATAAMQDKLKEHSTADGLDSDGNITQFANPAASLLENSYGNLIDLPIELIYEQFNQSMLFLKHDLLRISQETDKADRFLFDHRQVEPMADSYAMRLIAQCNWSALCDFARLVLAENPNQQPLTLPGEFLPYGWGSIMELAISNMGATEDLCTLYRDRIVESYDDDQGTTHVDHLREISGNDWPRQVMLINKQYAYGRGRFCRNLVYEQLMMDEGLSRSAWKYCQNFPQAKVKLAPTIAIDLPKKAMAIILGPIRANGRYEGQLPARRTAYQRIAQRLVTYARVFSYSEAAEIARNLVGNFPKRKNLAKALHGFLY